MVKSYNLKPGGDKIPVTKQNRKGESTAGALSFGSVGFLFITTFLLYLFEPAAQVITLLCNNTCITKCPYV